MTDRDLRLDQQVCFALYSASRAVIQLYRPTLDSLGLTYPQYLVMLVLWESGPRTVKQLGAELALDSGTLSPLLKRLESTGYVRRERCTQDERAVKVHLTESGAALRAQACAVPDKMAGATGMAPVDLVELRETLTRLTEAISSPQPEKD